MGGWNSSPICTSGSFRLGGKMAYSGFNRQMRPEFWKGPPRMKNPYDVLRTKEQELARVRKEMEALRIAARLLGADDPAADEDHQQKMRQVVEMP
jgi:hypothetical protein